MPRDLLEPFDASPDAGAAVAAARATGLGLVIDNFAGGGGASSGIEAAIGRAIDVAINHDPEAVAMHRANHPGTRHYCQSVWKADPQAVVDECGGGPVGLAWFSPDCKHFSKAKGGKPVEKNIRDLAWVVVLWAQRVHPRVIMLENVEEFRTWGPLLDDGTPCRDNKGLEYRRWLKELRKAGYRVEDRELRACDYGAPTSRKRLFVIARSDGEPIAWPAPTHGKPRSADVEAGRLQPWRTAAEIIDWTIPCPSIFERKRPLKDATCRRIAHGIMRFVVNAERPFIVPICHTKGGNRARSGDEPLPTITTAKGGELAIVAPVLTPFYGDKADGRVRNANKADEPLRTQSTENRFGLISATIVGCGGRRGQSGPVNIEGPYPTTTAKGDACLVAVALDRQFGRSLGADAEAPVPSITAGGSGKTALIAATLVKQNFGLNPAQAVTVPLHAVTTQANKFGVIAATLVSVDNTSTRAGRYFDPQDPLRTITASGGGYAAVSATLIQTSYGEREGQAPRVLDLGAPLGTIVAGGVKHSLVAAFLHKYRPDHPGQSLDDPAPTVTANSFIKRPGGAPPLAIVTAHIEQANTGMVGHPIERPLSTIVQKGCTQRLIASSLVKLRGTSKHGQPADEPLHTVSAGGTHFAEVAAFLVKYYGRGPDGHTIEAPIGSVTSKDRFGLVTVTVDGEEYVIADIGMRMLTPRELARAQGFPDDYILDAIVGGKPMTKTAQIRMIGNSVCPPLAEALVRANLVDESADEAEAA